MIRTIRLFMVVEAVSFSVAALIYSGALIAGYEHQRACIAESVIALIDRFRCEAVIRCPCCE